MSSIKNVISSKDGKYTKKSSKDGKRWDKNTVVSEFWNDNEDVFTPEQDSMFSDPFYDKWAGQDAVLGNIMSESEGESTDLESQFENSIRESVTSVCTESDKIKKLTKEIEEIKGMNRELVDELHKGYQNRIKGLKKINSDSLKSYHSVCQALSSEKAANEGLREKNSKLSDTVVRTKTFQDKLHAKNQALEDLLLKMWGRVYERLNDTY